MSARSTSWRAASGESPQKPAAHPILTMSLAMVSVVFLAVGNAAS